MTGGDGDIVTLGSGPSGLQVCPAAGGSITRYWWEHAGRTFEWLRPAAAADIAARNPLGLSCFPLVPFSGRIREGRFTFRERAVRLPLNFPPERHTIHGHGWQAPWTVTEATPDALVIEYAHDADAWPYPYRARQTFALGPASLVVTLELVNEGRAPMPAGLGLHPYFVRTAGARVLAEVDKIWLNDREVMPIELADPPAERRLGNGVGVEAVAMDNTFTGWSGRALVKWPEWDAHLTIAAESPLIFLVVYTPPGEDYFCVEPVSNIADAFNYADQGRTNTGLIVLAPGERAQGTMTLTPAVGAGSSGAAGKM